MRRRHGAGAERRAAGAGADVPHLKGSFFSPAGGGETTKVSVGDLCAARDIT